MGEQRDTVEILHLEDDPGDAALVAGCLKSAGIACHIVQADGRKSFEAALAQGSFQLIITDLDLPGYDGISALKFARDQKPGIPVIVLSGSLRKEAAEECRRLGAADCLSKGRMETLIPAMLRVLGI